MDLIDREPIRHELGNALDSFTDKQATIITGFSGIGKSCVTDHVLKGFTKFPALKVSRRHDACHQPGDYLTEVARQAINPHNRISFPIDFSEYMDDYIDKKRAVDLAIDGSRFIGIGRFIKTFLTTKKRKENLSAFLSYGFNSEEMSYCVSFLKCVFRSSPFVLNIENIQSIDPYSLEKLIDILKECERFYLILEYTNGHELSLSDIIEKFILPTIGVQPNCILMEQLEANEIISFARSRNYSHLDQLQHDLEHWDGNVRNLEDFFYTAQPTRISDGTRARLDELGSKEREILYLLATDYESVPYQIIVEMGYEREINTLESAPSSLIIREGERIRLAHDTIVPALFLNNGQLEKDSRLWAIDKWLNYYKATQKVPSRTASLKQLHFAICSGKVHELPDLIREIKPYIYGSVDPIKSIEDIEKIYLKTLSHEGRNEALDELVVWLIDLYQGVLQYEKAFELLQGLSPNNPNYFPLQVLLTYRCHHYDSARSKCETALETERDDHRILFYKLIHLESCYELGDLDSCQIDFNFLENNHDKFSKFVEYGFFYRNAELLKSYKDCVEYQSQGIKHFERYGATKQALSTRLTRGVHYALIGDFESALKDFEQVEKNKREYVGLLQACLNNQAVVHMYQHNFESVEKLLDTALLLPATNFDKIVMTLSRLGCCLGQAKIDMVIANQLEESLATDIYLGKEIRQYVHIALYRHYLMANNSEKADEHLNRARSIAPLKDYMEFWISEQNLKPINDDRFRCSFELPLSFISEWGIEFDYQLMRFQ